MGCYAPTQSNDRRWNSPIVDLSIVDLLIWPWTKSTDPQPNKWTRWRNQRHLDRLPERLDAGEIEGETVINEAEGGGTTQAIERAVSLTEIRAGVDRCDQRLSELHTRVTRIDEQLDRIEIEVGRIAAVMEARDKRAAQAIEARAGLIDKLLTLGRNPALWAAIGAGGLSIGGNQLCTASQAHHSTMPPTVVAPLHVPRGNAPGTAPEPEDTGP